MSFFADLVPSLQPQPVVPEKGDKGQRTTRCSGFLQFLAIAFSEEQYRKIGLHPVVTNSNPNFSDASMGGVSFDVRKVRVSSFPRGLDDEALDQKTFVVVKQPRLDQDRQMQRNALEEIATELQILRHTRHIKESNILELIGIVYHDANIDGETPYILPALVVEYAELGDLRSFLAEGFGHSIQERFEICQDVARGLDHLHRCGIVHCDVKDKNMLVCASKVRKFVVKVSDLGFALSLLDDSPYIRGYSPYWEAPEIHEPLQRTHLCQLDIYSYGILLYTVMKNGALFYEANETENRASHILMLKKSNFLPATMLMNLLLRMRDERCMLLIICKILTFCLHADAKKRFRSMHDLLKLLRWCDPSDLRREDHVGEPLYELLTSNVGKYMEYYPQLKSRLLNMFHESIKVYQAAIGDDLPLGQALADLYKKRFNVELEMFLFRPVGADNESFQYCPAMSLMLPRSLLGLLPLESLENVRQSTSNSFKELPSDVTPRTDDCGMICFCQGLEPEVGQIISKRLRRH